MQCAAASLRQPCMTAYCIWHITQELIISPGSGNQCILGGVYLKSIQETVTQYMHRQIYLATLAGPKLSRLCPPHQPTASGGDATSNYHVEKLYDGCNYQHDIHAHRLTGDELMTLRMS